MSHDSTTQQKICLHPGYQLRIVDEEGNDCKDGEIGELQINGPSAALMYWNNRAKTKATFAGEWTRSGVATKTFIPKRSQRRHQSWRHLCIPL
jgi:acyl-CoA synthetase (AMP-forming)/AMP-acid ligase II